MTSAANIARWAMDRALAATHKLGKEVNIIIAFARHLFANGVQFFKKSRALIHKKLISG